MMSYPVMSGSMTHSELIMKSSILYYNEQKTNKIVNKNCIYLWLT